MTTDDLPDDWRDMIINLMSDGGSKTEVIYELGIAKDTFNRLCDDDTEFLATVKKGVLACEAWWERKGRKELENKDFSATLWYMNMKNRFGWKDRQDVTTNDKDLPTPILPVGE
jgi:hypothetical protein